MTQFAQSVDERYQLVQLVRQAQSGDRQAFGDLVERFDGNIAVSHGRNVRVMTKQFAVTCFRHAMADVLHVKFE